MGIWGQGGSEFSGYDYVQVADPAEPEEGQTWYDTENDRAAVYDGLQWVEMTVTDHGQLGGITRWQHLDETDVQAAVHDRYTDSEAQAAVHDRYTDSEAIQAADGQVDAETLDGQHASAFVPTDHAPVTLDTSVWHLTGDAYSDGDLGTTASFSRSNAPHTLYTIDNPRDPSVLPSVDDLSSEVHGGRVYVASHDGDAVDNWATEFTIEGSNRTATIASAAYEEEMDDGDQNPITGQWFEADFSADPVEPPLDVVLGGDGLNNDVTIELAEIQLRGKFRRL